MKKALSILALSLALCACGTPSDPTDAEASAAISHSYERQVHVQHIDMPALAAVHIVSCQPSKNDTLACQTTWSVDGEGKQSVLIFRQTEKGWSATLPPM